MSPTPVIVFGIHELDEDRWELRRGGLPVPVQPVVFRLLLYLARHRRRVVTRRELLDALWLGTTVTESSLLRAITFHGMRLPSPEEFIPRIVDYALRHDFGRRPAPPPHDPALGTDAAAAAMGGM